MHHLAGLLNNYFGFDQFREGQQQTIEQLLAGHSSLAVFPTGSGKSLCYQFTATQLPNLTLVISPLIALMHDQLAFLQSKGIPSASLDSTQTKEESQAVMQQVRDGQIKILMISVERFKNERFRRFIQGVPISMLVVDEAHCISEWGHNFRPDYLKLPQYQQELNIPLVLLLTATATRRVQKDMALKFNIAPNHIVQTGFYRHNLDIDLISAQGQDKQALLRQVLNDTQGAGIVYVTQQKTADELAATLQQSGYSAVSYHAGLGNEVRAAIQNDFMAGQTRIIVATIAFGMGIDKSDIRFVVHYDLPKSIENYSQEIGRAGRDGQPSRCVMLASLDGLHVLENFVYGDTPEPHAIQVLLQEIFSNTINGEWETQAYGLSQTTNIRALPLKTLLVQMELAGAIVPRYSYYSDLKFKWNQSLEQIHAALPIEQQTVFNQVAQQTVFKKIWGVPDFERLHQQGLERGAVLSLLEQLADRDLITLETKGLTEVYGVRTELLTPALAEELQSYVTQKETSEIERIATMIRFFELDRCLNHNLARYFGDQQAPERCGHCSVCRGNVLSLAKNESYQVVDSLASDMQAAKLWLLQKLPQNQVTPMLLARFMAGLTQPVFTKLKARQQPSFAKYEDVAYSTLLKQAENL
ncbi:RecQ family ATP-dependent DNA helicase [Marinomonas communis]|uniref:RecQ family ATP-dependent DNA helicase n=1 Tax=Marinomonas communis TaxID=28254 RepID=UPI0010002C23|nr:ATP-dependent DNA helicase RecQ [Marinomonas communis]MCC4274009.1 RecQ family ATP-dependent DNA helicase [Marinomonas communis]RUM52617.1 MAG: recombinase RecQ [Marinomonas sp.]